MNDEIKEKLHINRVIGSEIAKMHYVDNIPLYVYTTFAISQYKDANV